MKKILFMGLEDTGKTTIIEFLKLKKNINCKNILPTRGRRIEEFNFNNQVYYVWELAGPLNYRKRWVKEKERIFTLINEIEYFINVQNVESYEESIKYLAKLISVLSELSEEIDPKFKLFIFLHKFDPNMVNLHDYIKSSKYITDKIKKMAIPYDYEVWKTSICNFQKNFSESLFFNKEILYFGKILSRLFT